MARSGWTRKWGRGRSETLWKNTEPNDKSPCHTLHLTAHASLTGHHDYPQGDETAVSWVQVVMNVGQLPRPRLYQAQPHVDKAKCDPAGRERTIEREGVWMRCIVCPKRFKKKKKDYEFSTFKC